MALRAIAIVLIVGSHIDVFDLPGGAHLLIGVVGFNLARFHLTSVERRARVRHLWGSIGRIAMACTTWIALACLLTDDYNLRNVFLLNEILGPHEGKFLHFWFVETLVYTLVAVAVLLAVPAVDRIERRLPFTLPAALVAVALIFRFDVFGLEPAVRIPTPLEVLWLFALGWAAGKAATGWQRVGVTLAVTATLPGYFDKPVREAVVIAGLCLLVWISRVPSHARLNQVAGILAGSSMYIYLTHWQVYPRVEHHSPVLALVVSLLFGVAYAAVATRATAALRSLSARFLPTVGRRRVDGRRRRLVHQPR